MLTVNLRKFRSLSAVYLKDHLPIVVTVNGFEMFLVTDYRDNQFGIALLCDHSELMRTPSARKTRQKQGIRGDSEK